MAKIDICIVAGRRPDLLSQTIASFTERMLGAFDLQNAYMNLDPVFGGAKEAEECTRIFKYRFSSGHVFQPETAGFAKAVQRVWSATTAEFVFHLEDDWIALTNIGQEALEPFLDPAVAQVSFHTAEKKWDIEKKGHFHHKKNHLRIAGLKIPTLLTTPIFTTSPSILRGDFARMCAPLLDMSLDPEKQFYSGRNERLQKTVSRRRNYIFSPTHQPVILDIGRGWRDLNGILKITENSVSTWVSEADKQNI